MSPVEDPKRAALLLWLQGEEPSYSTGICGSPTCGYGKLDENGYWEFPLDPRVVDDDRSEMFK